MANPDLSCYVLQNGSLQPIAQAISVPGASEKTSKTPSTRSQTPTAKTSQPTEPVVSPGPNHQEASKTSKRRETHNR